jgi:hypothetical protein
VSAALERRYERMLSLYPRSWREENGQVVIGTLLDMAAEQGRTDPTVAERVDLAFHGLLTRLVLVLPAAARNGVATVALSTGSAFGLFYFYFCGWAPMMRGREIVREWFAFGPFINPGVILCALWLTAFVCALFAWNRASKFALAGSIAVAIAIPWTNRLVPEWDGPSSMNLGFLVILALLALVGTPIHRTRLSIATAVWLIAFISLYAANDLLDLPGDRWFWTRIASPSNLSLAFIVVLAVLVVLLLMRRPTNAAVVSWSLLPWLAVWLVGIMNDDPYLALGIVVTGLVSFVLVALGGLILRRNGIVVRTVRDAE